MKFRRSIPIFLLNHDFNFTQHNITRCYLEEKRTVEREDLKVSCRFEIFWNFQITRPIREVKKKKKSVRIVRTCLKSGKALRGNQRALRNGERGEFSIISLRRVWNSGSLEGSGKRKKKKKKRTAWRGRGATKQTRKTSGEKGAGCYFMVETRARIHSHASWFASWFTRGKKRKALFHSHAETGSPRFALPTNWIAMRHASPFQFQLPYFPSSYTAAY